MDAEIIAVGSELLTPYRLDTNSLFLTAELNRLGFHVRRKQVIGDRDDDLRDAFLRALERVDVLISCGGLGPTEDDRTREIVAGAFGRKLKLNNEILRTIQERFRKFGRTMPEVNIRQAMVPEGAEPLANTQGTAPGVWLESGAKVVVLLPGPPSELQSMFAREVKPRLARRGANLRLYTRDLRTTGLPESDVDQRVAPIYKEYAGTETTILAAPGEIQLHPRVWSEDEATATKLLDEMVKRFALALGENLFSTSGETLEDVVAKELQEHRATIAVAESCTGGMLAARLTNVPGSSSYFRGGVVSYSNDLKSAWADVPKEIIESKGAVSPEVALALADGIRRSTGSTLGVGVTGIAGPGGGTPEKPVGLVHIAIADETGTKERSFRFPGARDRIRHQATQAALDMVRRYFLYAAPAAKA
ncbi:MAG TPA: competence/damage-inducible protein A [Candidatus Acidoferrales bacterium]|nr:competence/damage-inducible protein A [Candidatus Acidoferrales bacterium]